MKTVRKGVFETNSSSMHVLTISRDGYLPYDTKLNESISLRTDIDYSERCYIPRMTHEEKANFLYAMMIAAVGQTVYYKNLDKGEAYTAEEKDYNEAAIRYLDIWLDGFKETLARYGITVSDVDKSSIEIRRPGDKYVLYKTVETAGSYWIKSENYYFCWGLCPLVFGIDFMGLDDIRSLIKQEKCHFDAEFVILDGNTFLQGSDEMSRKEVKQQRNQLKKIFNKEKGRINISWLS